MAAVTVLIFHRPADPGAPALVRTLWEVREALARRQARMFAQAGAARVDIDTEWRAGLSFGELLAGLAPPRGGMVVLSAGAVPLLRPVEAARLVAAAAADERIALTNNRYSSDVCAVAVVRELRALPPLPSDNALPRWLEERAGYRVAELAGRERLALDLDTPLDVALVAQHPRAPAWLRNAARAARLELPRTAEIRALAADARRELVVFGRSGSGTLLWLERNVRCRVRFLAEERGLRASSPLAIGSRDPAADQVPADMRGPRATLGLLLDQRGPSALAAIIAELGDGAIIDSRVLLGHRLGADEASWPSAADRFASDLQRWADVDDPWLRALTKSASESRSPMLLGGHSLVGPGIRLVLRRAGGWV